MVLSSCSSCVASASCTSIHRRLFFKAIDCTFLKSSFISDDCLYRFSKVDVSLSDNGSSERSRTAVRYVKLPIFERNSSVLLNGSNARGNCRSEERRVGKEWR